MSVEVRSEPIREIDRIFDAQNAVKLAVYLGNRVGGIKSAPNNSWEGILSLDERSLKFVGIGKKTLERLDTFKRSLGEKAKTSAGMPGHIVEYVTYGRTSYYRRGLYIIDGFPISFPSLSSNEAIISLLRGIKMFVSVDNLSAVNKRKKIDDIEGDIRFLNQHFALGLEFCRVKDGEREYISLKVPQKTKVA